MKLHRVLPYAKELIRQTVEPGETLIDATAGNGNDTEFLAELVGENGHVLAFDIQQQALDTTYSRLGSLNERATLILDSHANVQEYVTGEIGGAMFNLGYLPYGEDLTIITEPDSTIKAVERILGLLKVGGIVTITVYDGHIGGDIERGALLDYVKHLHQRDVHVIRYELVNQRKNPPFLIDIEKMRSFTTPRQVE